MPFRPIGRWELFDAIKTCKSTLGLNNGDLAALRAMYSFLPLKQKNGSEAPALPDMLLICYASNVSICTRANGMDESSLRRHIRRLVDAGLVSRNDSATGKRFPLKRNGKVEAAYGIDLRPAFENSGRIIEMARKVEEDAELKRMIRSETFALRRRIYDSVSHLPCQLQDWLEGLTKILRRKSVSIDELRMLRDRLQSLVEKLCHRTVQHVPDTDPTPAPQQTSEEEEPELETSNLTASDVQNTRAVESQTLNNKKKDRSEPKRPTKPINAEPSSNLSTMLGRYPNAMSFFPERIASASDLDKAIEALGASLGLRNVPFMALIKQLGIDPVMRVIDRMVLDVERITHPQSYFETAILQKAQEASVRL
jgi:replication initiation protein RepC